MTAVPFKISHLARLMHYNNNFLHFKECTLFSTIYDRKLQLFSLRFKSSRNSLSIFKSSFPPSFLRAFSLPVRLIFLILHLLASVISGLLMSFIIFFIDRIFYTACLSYQVISSLYQRPYPIYL